MGTVRHIVEDGFREGVRALKQHSDLAAQLNDIGVGRKDIVTVEQDLTGSPRVGHQIMHPIENSQEGGLATTRGADQRRDLPGLHR